MTDNMTQTNNERESHLTKVLKLTALERAIELQSIHGSGAVDLGCLTVLQDMVDELKTPISQNEQQEAVAFMDEDGEIYALPEQKSLNISIDDLIKSIGKNGVRLYPSPPKQAIPEGWISVKDRLPDNDYEVIFVLLKDLNCGITFSYDGAKSSIEDRVVDISISRTNGKWNCSQGIYDLEKIAYWMTIPTAPTNTEVGK